MVKNKRISADDAGELMVSVDVYTRTRDSVSFTVSLAARRCAARVPRSSARQHGACDAPFPITTTIFAPVSRVVLVAVSTRLQSHGCADAASIAAAQVELAHHTRQSAFREAHSLQDTFYHL